MKVFGQLEAAQAEHLSADPTGTGLVLGRIWYNTTDNVYRGYNGTDVEEFADLTTAQTFQNKTAEGLVVSDYIEFNQQGSTPSNPAAGKNRIYFKTDGTAYTLDENGNEVPLGSGSGGSKNYFDDVDAEIDSTIGNWETDDGVGGSSAGLTLSLTNIAGELLAGANSLKLEKDAANRDGHFIKVLSKTIDPSDRGRPNYGSFEFRPGTGYVSDDLVFEVYDVTNAAVLYSGPVAELGLLNSKGRFDWVTYLDETTAQVEFRIKVNNTNTNSFEAFFDEFKFGPAAITAAPIITEWQSYTPVGTWSTNTTYLGRWRRVGDSMEVNITVQLAGAPNAGTFTASIPAGYTMDLAKIADSNTKLGNAYLLDFSTAGNRTEGNVQYFSATDLGVLAIGGSTVTNASPFTFGTTDEVRIKAMVPITGWSSGAVLGSNELGLQTIRAEMYRTTDQNILSSAPTLIEFDGSSYDTHGIVDLVNRHFEIPKTGFYNITCGMNFAAVTTDERVTIDVRKNGAGLLTRLYRAGPTDGPVQVDKLVFLQKGDLITVTSDSNADTNYLIRGGNEGVSYITITSAPDFTVIGAADDQNFFESAEQDLPGAITWNNITPGGTLIKKYKWFQKGKIVDFFFWFDYSGAFASNTFCFFDLPPDMPIPALQQANSTQTSQAGSAHVGNGGSIGTPAAAEFLNSTGRVYVTTNGAVNTNEVHGHIRYYID